MNPYTGHLVKSLDMVPEIKAIEYEPVPRELERAVQKKLAGKSEATVSLTSGGRLSKWAAGKRSERKAKNQMAKESRRKNRGR